MAKPSLCQNFINRPVGSYRPLACRPIVVQTRELRGTGLANKQDLFFLTKPNTIREHATLDLLYPAPFYVQEQVDADATPQKPSLTAFIGVLWTVNNPADVSLTFDGDFNTKTDNFVTDVQTLGQGNASSLIWDFGEVLTTKFRVKFEHKIDSQGFNFVFTSILVSKDNITYEPPEDFGTNLDSFVLEDFTSPSPQTFRYLKLSTGVAGLIAPTEFATVNIYEAARVE